jgi:formylglycine-generating enzyme required for sulfatase activity
MKMKRPSHWCLAATAAFVLSATAQDEKQPKVETVDLGGGVNLEMVLLPAAKFIMGVKAPGPQSKDNPQHEVTITKPFYIGKYEVTQEQWQAVMGSNPSEPKGPKLPVTNVSWDDCQVFIKKLNEKSKGGYRLPTDAEWEYACRGGTQTAFAFGDTITQAQANFGYGNAGKVVAVGSYKPNAFGLYDMHGNVWEWCQDWNAPLTDKAVTDPTGPATGKDRILRGGCFYDDPGGGVSSTFRYEFEPNFGTIYFGFRLARTIQ